MRDFRINIFVDAISGVYDRGIEELRNIGVATMRSEECANWFGNNWLGRLSLIHI